MKTAVKAFLMVILLAGQQAVAQQATDAWVQIEAHPSESVAIDRARIYEQAIAGISAFALGGNWYGIAVGPFTREEAQSVLARLKAERQVPRDSFIAFTSNFGAQIWPPSGAAPAPEPANAAAATPDAPRTEPQPGDETPAEARRSEAALDADERRDLQLALQTAGFYDAAIDGAFGRGTRASMAAWQAAKGYEATGVLTTRQRQALLEDHNAPLTSVGMAALRDETAGIAMDLPLGAVAFARYDPPFAHYEATGDLAARVLLISQPGGTEALAGLYEIMQTLEIVPLEGPRQRDSNGFTLEGRGGGIVSHTEAELKNGRIKGFTLVWPEGDEERRARVLAAMQASFTRLDGVLDPAAGEGAQDIDLVAGLQVRRPRVSRTGFYVDARGHVLTTQDVTEGCTRITLDEDREAERIAADPALGVAVLSPREALAPMAFARLSAEAPRLRSDVTVSGFSYGGDLGGPTLTFGTLEDVKGLNGEPELQRLALAALPGDAGGPVIDISGGVVGLLLPEADDAARQLPGNVAIAADAEALRRVLEDAGIAPETSTERGALPPEQMNRLAMGMTVLVSCWE